MTEATWQVNLRQSPKPLLWYAFMTLYEQGFRHFILPLGYKGELIREFVDRHLRELHASIEMVETGEDTPIAGRISRVVDRIPEHEDFFLLNGDTYFDFDIFGMYQLHRRRRRLLTLSSVQIHSSHGLIIEREGRIVDFTRDSTIASVMLSGGRRSTRGFVNAGLSFISKDALGLVDLETCGDFESDLFPKIIATGRAAHYRIEGHWFPIDTQTDLETVNLRVTSSNRIGAIVKDAKKNLANRYMYKTRYFGDPEELKEKILDKTILPHQVEVQPGPDAGKAFCWLRCPYCYGGSSKDSQERLTPERYAEILKQIAEGGVNKIVFAGYATDPLHYSGVDDLLQVVQDSRQIFGFHTKALKFTDRFLELVTRTDVMPLSYFSVSVDAGSDDVYNSVHGVRGSKATLYQNVLKNLERISNARARTNAPLDLSATYLVNDLNSSNDEVLGAIRDLRSSGVDLIRFTFPQTPRGYTAAMDPWIPNREQIDEMVGRLTPLIEQESSGPCQVLILDLDADYDTYHKTRTVPCFARFVFPSIGFDGYLSHCSESAAPHFRPLAIGNLQTRDFWDLFYDYDANAFNDYMANAVREMVETHCICDRKEHVVNEAIARSGVFDKIL